MLSRTILGFAEEFRAGLEAHGLTRFDQFMRDPALGELIVSKPGREIRRVTIVAGTVRQDFFLKRTWPDPADPKRGRLLAALRHGTLPHQAAWREFIMVRAMRAAGLPVMAPAAWGERRVLGVGRESFLMVQAVEGQELEKLFTAADQAVRARLLSAMGLLLGQMHGAGFFESVRLRDVFCTALPDDPRSSRQPASLVLIDRDTYAPRARQPDAQRCAEEVARCYCKFIQQNHRLSGAEARVFVRGYRRGVEQCWHDSHAQMLEAIALQVARMTAPGRKYHGMVESPALARRR